MAQRFIARGLFLGLVLCAIGIVFVNATTPQLDTFQNEVRTQLLQSSDLAMKADCWREGGHGSGAAIAGFNDRLPVALAALLAKPEAQSLSVDQIESLFFKATSQSLTLIKGDDHVFLGTIVSLYCTQGSHDRAPTVAYVLDRSGHNWKIGAVNSIQAFQWVEDRWIGIASEPLTYSADELWVISPQNNGWVLTDKPVHLGSINQSMTYALKDGYHTFISTINTIRIPAPCEGIQHMSDYYTNLYSITNTYAWSVDHYVLVRTGEPAVTVIFMVENRDPKPDLLAVKATPFYRDGNSSPIAYWVDKWQALCK
ncbi:MAG: hypothetical protein ABI947_20135 [Chloroflexota bacterium]